MVLPFLLAQAATLAPAHVGADASVTVPILIIVATVVAFVIRLEVRQHFQGKDIEKLEKDHGKRLDKGESEQEVLAARVQKVEQEQAVQAVTLGRIDGGVERIEQRLDTVLAGRGYAPPPARAGG
jgi:uncharacterized coiled-coil protein SlyX